MNVTALPFEPKVRPVRLTVHDFDLLFRAGALERVPRVELMDGMICEMNPQYSDHSFIKDEVVAALRAAAPAPLRVFSETSLILDQYNMPAPDVALCEPFPRGGPLPLESVRILVKVSVNTLADDLGRKRALYAGAGVPEYWVVNVLARAIHVFATPDRGRAVYADARVVAFGAPLLAQTVTGMTIDTAPLL